MMFAQSFFDLGLTESLLHIVKIIAAVGGAVVGWFVCDPLTRVAYRLSFKGATPASVLLLSKFTGAAALSIAAYFLVSFGSGGLGFGPGPGGLPGKGPGQGGDKGLIANSDGKNGKSPTKDKVDPVKKNPYAMEPIEIEIINNKRLDDIDNERFFLLQRAEPPLTSGQLEDYFKKNHAKIEVTPVLVAASIGEMDEDNPLSRLIALAKKYNVKTLQTKRP